jgi:hypothetical protein
MQVVLFAATIHISNPTVTATPHKLLVLVSQWFCIAFRDRVLADIYFDGDAFTTTATCQV